MPTVNSVLKSVKNSAITDSIRSAQILPNGLSIGDLVSTGSNMNNGMSLTRSGFYAFPTRFQVTITLPPALQQNFGTGELILGFIPSANKVKNMNSRVEMAELPGRSIATTEAKTVGPSRKMPYTALYNEVPMTFQLSEDMYEKKLFEAWHDLMYNPRSNTAGYYDDYVTTVQIDQLSIADEVTHSVKLIEAYPAIVSPMMLDSSSTSAIHKVVVSWNYHRYESGQGEGSFPNILAPRPLKAGFGKLNNLLSAAENAESVAGNFLGNVSRLF